MRALWLVLLGLSGVLLFAGCGGPSSQQTMKDSSSAKPAAVVQDMPPICPVTGHRIEDLKAAPSSVYEGKRYYFQCPSCKAEFDREPAKYVAGFADKQAAAKKDSHVSDKTDDSEAPN